MSDDANQFFNAWSEVFGKEGCTKLLCAWHVDRSWRRSLHEKIGNIESRTEVYYYLQTLLQESTESTFRVMLQKLLVYLEENEPAFADYFRNWYCTRLQQWAPCYRQHTIANTNMYLESFHRLLKIIYLNHKQNRRIDYLLVTLTKISRDKAFERLLKVEKGKYTHRLTEINKRHKSALLMSSFIQPYKDNNMKWQLESKQKKVHSTLSYSNQSNATVK